MLRFADALVDAGAQPEAVDYVTSQLGDSALSSYLAWLADAAEKNQDPESALKWRLSLVDASPNLKNYQSLRQTAQQLGRWGTLRPELIHGLESQERWDLLVEIALEEGDVRRALDLAPRQRYGVHDLSVAQAAEAEYPQEAILLYRRMVDQLIAVRGRENYRAAAELLYQIQALYRRLGGTAEWESYFAGLRAQNSRLRAFQDELVKAGL